MLKTNGFPKQERIVSQKLTDELFTGGRSSALVAFPLRAVYQETSNLKSQPSNLNPQPSTLNPQISTLNPQPSNLQVLFSVPKRRFKHAVDRNRVKRQLREAYRLNRPLLAQRLAEGQRLAIAFVWLSDQHLPTADVAKRMRSLLQRIAAKCATANVPQAPAPQTPAP